MKEHNPKQYAGVWLDSQHAMILAQSENENGDFAILDKVRAGEYHGGKGEHAMNNADQSNNLKYYKSIANLLLKYDEILVFGPGKSQEQLLNFLKENAQFNNKKISIDNSKHLTDPQMIAKVRDFFNPHPT